VTQQESSVEVPPDQLCALPIIGRTTVEDAVFYSITGAVAVVGWVSWPTAALFATAHALHQRARNIRREGAVEEVRSGLLEVVDEIA